MKKTYNLPEAARELGISRNLIYRLAREGHLPVIKLGKRVMISSIALEQLLAGADIR